MKKTILSLCLLLLLTNSCQKRSSELDEIIVECYDKTYQEAGYDMKSIIDDYEKELVKKGILKDTTGKSYLEVLQKISSDKDFRITVQSFTEYDPFFKVDNETKLAIFQCENRMIESLKEKDPKWRTLSNPTDSAGNMGNPKLGYVSLMENMSDEDLNSYYFRLKMFHIFDGVNSQFRDRSSMPAKAAD
ncbi:hypothetical protein [Muriicola jejuensis]|uniref:Uncharacterized protein n=1 Tax=Muriicola jejuensis TaxID=504488 RepID=A0A6P0UJM3_9FLAO|nr:hypothetical protein [Muriicola jejuensis]NER10406.1 hypothetical protein [Muriicola jejuensis]